MNIEIGKRTQIHETAIIGAQPLTLKRNEDGDFIHKVASQGVVIGDDCSIGAYTVIKSGTKNPTTIDDHVHIAEFVNIAHDCKIRKNTMIMPHVVLNGWVEIGKNVKIFSGVLIRNRIKIGDNSVIGMGSVVVKDVPANSFGYGHPFKPQKRRLSLNNLKILARTRGLPI